MAKYWIRLLVSAVLVMVFTAFFIQPIADTFEPRISTHIWTVDDSKAYANDRLGVWKDKQMSCLNKLWSKESAWNPEAYNKIKVMGKNAGGIPQLLGLDPATPPTQQIDRGLSYIYYRYGTPCLAWAHFQKKGWH